MATATMTTRPPLPPFTREIAIQKIRLAEDSWNTRDPGKVALAYAIDSRWRNRSEFVNGRDEITTFLSRKWVKELDYSLIKELWVHREPHCGAVRLRMARRFGSLRLAQGPVITVPTITLEGDANGAPHPEPSAYANRFSGKYSHQTIKGGIGHNLPQESPQSFAEAVIQVDGY